MFSRSRYSALQRQGLHSGCFKSPIHTAIGLWPVASAPRVDGADGVIRRWEAPLAEATRISDPAGAPLIAPVGHEVDFGP